MNDYVHVGSRQHRKCMYLPPSIIPYDNQIVKHSYWYLHFALKFDNTDSSLHDAIQTFKMHYSNTQKVISLLRQLQNIRIVFY
jgi:hypothetical protein